MTRARIIGIVSIVAITLASAGGVRAYVTSGRSWPSGSIVMHLQLGSGGTLSDGSTSWNDAVEGQLAAWNTYLARSSFAVVRNSSSPIASNNRVNNVFFSSTLYGTPFGANVLAITESLSSGDTQVECDVVFNTAFSWDAYAGRLRSNSVVDIRRVALHEFGHVLGLLHPNDYGQSVSAIMNASVGDLDTLTADDAAGARAIYGGSITPTAAPGAPSGLTSSASGGAVTLRWTAPSGGGTPTSYVIEAGSGPGSSNLANVSTGNSATTYAASNVGAGVYYVRVRAANSAGVSAASNESILVVGGGCSSAPTAPTALIGSASGSTVTLAWGPSGGGASTYVVEAGSAPGLSNLANSDLGSATPSLVAPNISRGIYYVRVRGKNGCGAGPVSNEITVVVQ